MNNDSRTRLVLSLTGSPTRKIADMALFPFICLVGVISKIFHFEKPFLVFRLNCFKISSEICLFKSGADKDVIYTGISPKIIKPLS